jgi:hypothetical protein
MWSDKPTRIGLPGFIVAVLALISQLALGGAVLPDQVPANGIAALAAAMVDCAPAIPGHPPAPTPRHDDSSALCPLSVALALPSVILTPAAVLPPPMPIPAMRTAMRPPARAPPNRVPDAAFPRGPPALA